MTIEATNTGTMDKYNKPVDLLQILLDAEVGNSSAKETTVSHLTMQQSEEDYNSNYEVDSGSHLKLTSSSHNHSVSKTESQQAQPMGYQSLSEKSRKKLSLDVSVYIFNDGSQVLQVEYFIIVCYW